MYLLYSVYVLIAGLYLSSSAPTPEDCDPLLTPLPLDNTTMLHGRWNFIAGFTDHELYNSILKTVDSSWLRFTPLPSSNNTLTMSHNDMINGKCNSSVANMTIVGNTAHVEIDSTKCSFQLLPSCSDCLLFNIHYVEKMVDRPIHSLYILARSQVLEESILETFRMQADCLKFSQPPNFHYDPKKDFCDEDEDTKM